MSGQQQQSNMNNIRPPQFIAAGVPAASSSMAQQQRGGGLNLDDIFGDCFFTPEGEAIFLSENPQFQQQQLQAEEQKLSFLTSGETNGVAQNASRPNTTGGGGFALVAPGGGIVTTGLHEPKASATVMGAGVPPPAAPFVQAPQRPHHLQYAFVQANGGETQAPMMEGNSASLAAVSGTNSARGAASSVAVGGMKKESSQDRRWEKLLVIVAHSFLIMADIIQAFELSLSPKYILANLSKSVIANTQNVHVFVKSFFSNHYSKVYLY